MIVLFLALGVARAQLTECTGYVNLPQKNIVSLKDVKVSGILARVRKRDDDLRL